MWGTMPRVHPNAASTLARGPRANPAASVKSTPVPGEATTMREVIKNSGLMWESDCAVWVWCGDGQVRGVDQAEGGGGRGEGGGVDCGDGGIADPGVAESEVP